MDSDRLSTSSLPAQDEEPDSPDKDSRSRLPSVAESGSEPETSGITSAADDWAIAEWSGRLDHIIWQFSDPELLGILRTGLEANVGPRRNFGTPTAGSNRPRIRAGTIALDGSHQSHSEPGADTRARSQTADAALPSPAKDTTRLSLSELVPPEQAAEVLQEHCLQNFEKKDDAPTIHEQYDTL